MTLIVAIALPGKHVWMGGDRLAGGDTYLAGPKIFRLETGDGVPFLVGFAGAPRVAQVVLASTPPDRMRKSYSLHWWLTTYCNVLAGEIRDHSLMVQSGNDCSEMAGQTTIVLGIEGQVIRIGCDLAWEQAARSWEATGAGAWCFYGAYDARKPWLPDPITRARTSWRTVTKHIGSVGRLADELRI